MGETLEQIINKNITDKRLLEVEKQKISRLIATQIREKIAKQQRVAMIGKDYNHYKTALECQELRKTHINSKGISKGKNQQYIGRIPYDLYKLANDTDSNFWKDKRNVMWFFRQYPQYKVIDEVRI